MTAHRILPKLFDTALSSVIVASQSSHVMINLGICAVLGKQIEYLTSTKNIVVVMLD
jgi:hypothetical protein